jgi:predicted transposase/invertase (TIGR01784 family)
VVFILSYRELRAERFHSIFRVQEVHDQEQLSDQLEIHLVELPKLSVAGGENREQTLVNWGKFLTATTDREREQLAMEDPIFAQAKTALERLSADPEARLLAEQREMALQSYQLDLGKVYWQGEAAGRAAGEAAGRAAGEATGRAVGIREGKAEGIREGKVEGRAEGERSLLQRLLVRKFGPLPAEAQARIQTASRCLRIDPELQFRRFTIPVSPATHHPPCGADKR